MQVNITGLETNMCSNIFDEKFIAEKSEKQLAKYTDKNSVLQVVFSKIKNEGKYATSLNFNTQNKVFSASSDNSNIASKSFSEALDKLTTQLRKSQERSKNKGKGTERFQLDDSSLEGAARL